MTAPSHSDAPVWSPDPTTEATTEAEETRSDPIGADPRLPEAEPVRPVPAASAVANRRRQGGAATRLLAIGAIVAVAGLGFAIGRVTVPSTSTSNGSQAQAGGFGPAGSFDPGAGPGGRGFDGAGGGAATVEGTVESVGDGTMTVKLANGSTVTIATNSSTAYHGQQAASQSDVAAGQTVTVQVTTGATASGATASQATASGATASGAPSITRTATDVTITGAGQ